MGNLFVSAMKMKHATRDIPQLTEYLANNPTFIKWALKVNKSSNKGLSAFQKFLHESAFPEEREDHHSHHKAHEKRERLDNHSNNKWFK